MKPLDIAIGQKGLPFALEDNWELRYYTWNILLIPFTNSCRSIHNSRCFSRCFFELVLRFICITFQLFANLPVVSFLFPKKKKFPVGLRLFLLRNHLFIYLCLSYFSPGNQASALPSIFFVYSFFPPLMITVILWEICMGLISFSDGISGAQLFSIYYSSFVVSRCIILVS